MAAGPVPRNGVSRHRGAHGGRIVDTAAPERAGDATRGLSRGQGGDELRRCGGLRRAGECPRRARQLRAGPLARARDRSERYFAAHGEISTFLGRMLPVVRHLISIPAGIARMHLGRFVVFTGLGALVWCTILTWIGWFIGSREDVILEVFNQEAKRYAGRAVLVVLPVLAGIAAIYIWWYRRRAAQGRQG